MENEAGSLEIPLEIHNISRGIAKINLGETIMASRVKKSELV